MEQMAALLFGALDRSLLEDPELLALQQARRPRQHRVRVRVRLQRQNQSTQSTVAACTIAGAVGFVVGFVLGLLALVLLLNTRLSRSLKAGVLLGVSANTLMVYALVSHPTLIRQPKLQQ